MIRRFPKVIALILSFIMILSICGVSATWILSDGSAVQSQSLDLTADLGEFIYIDSLIEAIIKEMNDVDSDIETNLQERFSGSGNSWSWLGYGKYYYYGSMDPQHNDTGIAALLEDYENMSFIVQAVIGNNETTSNYTTAYIYTCDRYLGVSGESEPYKGGITGNIYGYTNTKEGSPTTPIGEYIYRIYRTEVHRDDANSDWEEVETLLGAALSDWYDENRSGTPKATMIPSYDIANWKEITMGSVESDSVFIYGDTEVGSTTSFTAYNDLYSQKSGTEHSDLEKANYNSGYNDFYLVMLVGGESYDAGFENYTGIISHYTMYYTYNYTPEGSYTVTSGLSTAIVTILDSSGNELDITGNGTSNSVTFTASTAGTKYYIKLSSSGATANVSVTYNGT